MTILIRSALVALVLASASSAMARPIHDPYFTDMSKPYGGYAHDSQEGQRAFWDYMSRH